MSVKFRASTKTVQVRCPKDKDVSGVAAANAVTEQTPHRFRALCPKCGEPLRPMKK